MAAIPDVNTSVYNKLKDASAISNIVGTKIADMQAPAAWETPYVVFELPSGLIPNITPRDTLNYVYRVHSWSTSGSQIKTLHAAVYGALHEQAVTISGWTNYWLVCEQEQRFKENVEGVDYYHFVWDVRLSASKD